MRKKQVDVICRNPKEIIFLDPRIILSRKEK